jgi:hypothetical protein
MPALFAYLIALGLLFGAGYGALNWLAEPPVKVAAKANSKSKSQPSYQQAPSSYQARSQEIAEASLPARKSDESSAASKSSIDDYDVASASRDHHSQAQPSLATDDEAKPRKADPSVKPAVPADPPTSQPSSAASAPGAIDRPPNRSHSRQAGSHFEKRKLVAMTLRTIEFPDGRRITQLIPLGGGESLPR